MGDLPVHILTSGLIAALAVAAVVGQWVYYRGERGDDRSYIARLEREVRDLRESTRHQDAVIKAAEAAGFVASDHRPHGRHAGGGPHA